MELTLQETDLLLKPSKGWKRNINGYEYVYDYIIPSLPVMIKVFSSVQVPNPENKRNKNSDCIRIFALHYKENKILGGLVKSQIVEITENWATDLVEAYKTIQKQAYIVCSRKGLLK